jgi:hypothetical protein
MSLEQKKVNQTKFFAIVGTSPPSTTPHLTVTLAKKAIMATSISSCYIFTLFVGVEDTEEPILDPEREGWKVGL